MQHSLSKLRYFSEYAKPLLTFLMIFAPIMQQRKVVFGRNFITLRKI